MRCGTSRKSIWELIFFFLRLPGAGVGLVARSLTGSEDKLSVNEVGLNRKLAIVLRCSLGRNPNSAFYYPLVVEPPEVKTGHQ